MSSFTISPLRAASRHIRVTPRNLNSIQSIPYAVRTAATTSTSTAASTSKPKPATTSYSNSTSNKPATSAKSSYATKPAARTPIPPVSGQPLPDAPRATTSPSPSYANSNNGGGEHNNGNGETINWENSYHGIGTSTFSPETAAVLQAPIDPDDIEVKPDGIIYLPEIKYRRILNAAFGPGGWGLAPRGELMVQDRLVTREYALIVHGR